MTDFEEKNKQTAEYLKSRFKKGACPKQKDYEDLIDYIGRLMEQQAEGIAGPKGDRGNGWFSGTELTGDRPDVDISNTKVGDLYLNTNTGDIYKYKSIGWDKVGKFEGTKGDNGEPFRIVAFASSVRDMINENFSYVSSIYDNVENFQYVMIRNNDDSDMSNNTVYMKLPISSDLNIEYVEYESIDEEDEHSYINNFLGVQCVWQFISDMSGPQGFDGATGPQGEQGFQGATGPKGFDGATGPQGFQGATGPQGEQGVTGPQGLQGATGPKGFDGATGPQGFDGATGPQGFQGATGPQGLQGEQGVTGPQGLQGATGPQGERGTNWLNGTIVSKDNIDNIVLEENVNIGDYYLNSSTGDIFVCININDDNTISWQYIGTFNDMLNDKFEKIELVTSAALNDLNDRIANISSNDGATGPQGFDGATGPQGIQGFDGATGPQGYQGATGPQGNDGKDFSIKKTYESVDVMNLSLSTDNHDGLEPGDFVAIAVPGDNPELTDSDNASLYVITSSYESSFIMDLSGASIKGEIGATGPQGFDGATGPQGFDGATGPQGFDGATGPQGEQGFQGATGPQGETGPSGTITSSDITQTLPTSQQSLATDITLHKTAWTGKVSDTVDYQLLIANRLDEIELVTSTSLNDLNTRIENLNALVENIMNRLHDLESK